MLSVLIESKGRTPESLKEIMKSRDNLEDKGSS